MGKAKIRLYIFEVAAQPSSTYSQSREISLARASAPDGSAPEVCGRWHHAIGVFKVDISKAVNRSIVL